MKNFIKNSACEKFENLISHYFKNNLSKKDEKFFKNHYNNCKNCQQKYFLMEKIYQNFKKVEEKYSTFAAVSKEFTINEYKIFNENISAYVDNELNKEENLAVKKILIKNIFAKNSYCELNNLIELMKTDFQNYSKAINFREFIRNFHFYLKKYNFHL